MMRLIIAILFFSHPFVMFAQNDDNHTMIIHMKDGEKIKYATEDIDSITFGQGNFSGNDDTKDNTLDALFDINSLPEIKISFSSSEWNQLLVYYDEDRGNKNFVRCSFEMDKDGTTCELSDIGARIRGAWSRNRPEGAMGESHQVDNTDWHHCSFSLNFAKFVKDDNHVLDGVKKIDLKYFNVDPAYVREIYIYDLLKRFGISTSIRTSYCRLYVYVEGDSKPAYYGIYMMMEHIDKNYLKDRMDLFGDAKGNLWKCEDATLASTEDSLFYVDDNSSSLHNYELKTNEKNFEEAKNELKSFIHAFQTLQGERFHDWILSRCDVELLLRTYAVIVTCGNWDDYWNNRKNYYLYFNSDHKFFFIPFDMDNSLGICVAKNEAQDTGRTDPFHWGLEECNLISKLLEFPDFRLMYANALKELIEERNGYFSYEASSSRIKKWWSLIADYIDNDTEEHCKLVDSPTFGTIHKEYRLIDSQNNFFVVRSSFIEQCICYYYN